MTVPSAAAAAVWKPRRFTLPHAITPHASVGDRVLLEGETRQVLGFAVLVYLLPLVLFFVGYGVGAGMKLGGGLSCAHRRRAVRRAASSGGDLVQPEG